MSKRIFSTIISILLVTTILFLAWSIRPIPTGSLNVSNELGVVVPTIAEMIAQINETEIYDTVLSLQSFISRAYGKPGNAQAAAYLYNRLTAISPKLAVQYQGPYNNVIATLHGRDDVAYIVGAHYDSKCYSDMNNAPGATDNGAGVAIVLEFARIFSHYNFNHTLMFAFWNREEDGMAGSTDFVNNVLPTYTDLYFNFDSAALITATRLDVMYNDLSAPIAALLDEYNTLYGIGLPLEHNAHTCGSDHVPFGNAGKKTIFTHQQVYAGSPTPNLAADHEHQHTVTDTMEYVSTTFAKKNGQLGMSLVAALTEPIVTTIIVPDDFSAIQAAINHADPGGTIFVRNGTYYEKIAVNKTVSLLGENRYGTIIDGQGEGSPGPSGNVILVTANDSIIRGFTVKRARTSDDGVRVDHTSNNTLRDNVVSNNDYGIVLLHSSGSKVSNNIVRSNINGIILNDYSANNTILDNAVTGNNQSGIVVENHSSANLIHGNTVVGNSYGVNLYSSYSGNKLYHNNFVDNTKQVYIYQSGLTCIWDNGCEGNFWSDHEGSDSDHDGVIDSPYIVDAYNRDNYPLLNKYWTLADVNHDMKVDILDVVAVTGAYGSTPSQLFWNPHADISAPFGKIDILDVVLCTAKYGERLQ